MQYKSVISIIGQVTDEFNKDRIPSERISKLDAEKIVRVQFRAMKQFMRRPFYPSLNIKGLLTLETKISYIRGVLFNLIGVMKAARNKGLEGEKDYYEAAKSFGYWRTLYHKTFVYVSERSPAKKAKYHSNALIKADRLNEFRAKKKPVSKVQIRKKYWSITDKFMPYEEWILTDEYLQASIHKRSTWGKKEPLPESIVNHVKRKIEYINILKANNMTLYKDVNSFNRLIKDINIKKIKNK